MMRLLLMTKATGVEGRKGVWQKMRQSVYASWVPASANMLSLAGKGVFLVSLCHSLDDF